MLMVGTAGWSIPRDSAIGFPAEGTHLGRYATRLPCVEINSSFYRPHSAAVYGKWAAQTPPHFRFSVKLPKLITHTQQLRRARSPLTDFLGQVRGLGTRLGPILVQLPPSFEFNARAVGSFFTLLRELHDGPVVCEPRNPTWFTAKAESLLHKHQVCRVAADPPATPAAGRPGGWPGVAYYRLHGSPRMYWSGYTAERLADWWNEMQSLPGLGLWCIFDNTANGAAMDNALHLQGLPDLDGRHACQQTVIVDAGHGRRIALA